MRSVIGSLSGPDTARLASVAAPWLEEREPALRATLDLLVPVVLGALVERAATFAHPRRVFADFHATVIDPAVDQLLAEPQAWPRLAPRVTASGTRLADALLGEQGDALAEAVATLTRVKPVNAWCLLTILLPVVCLGLRRMIREASLTGEEFCDLLDSVRGSINAAIDPRLHDEFAAISGRQFAGAVLPRATLRSRSLSAGPFAARGNWQVPLAAFVRMLLGGRR